MTAKLFGCGLLLAAALSASIWKLRKDRRRLALLEGWINLLRRLKDEIEYRMTPLSRILYATDPDFLDLLGVREKSFACYLSASEKELDKDTTEVLSALFLAFDQADRAELIAACEHALSLLSNKRSLLAEDLPKKRRLTISVSLLAAGLVILLLW